MTPGVFSSFSPTRRLTIFYIVALSCVALLALLAQFSLQLTTGRGQTDAHVVNVAGRQRMLSQRIAKCAVLLGTPLSKARRAATSRELRQSLSVWESSHAALLRGDARLGLSGPPSGQIKRHFDQISPDFNALRRAGRRLLRISDSRADSKAMQVQIEEVLRREAPFLRGMDAIVSDFDLEIRARTEQQQMLRTIYFGLTLLVLLLEGIFVFRPATRHIDNALRDLRRSQNRQNALLEALPDALLLFDAGGNLVEARPALAEQIAGPMQIHFARHVKAALAVGHGKTFEFRHEDTARDYEARLVLLHRDQMRGGLALVRDITDRKEVERLKDEFISTVSHELRTPLTSIRGALGLLDGGVVGELPPRAVPLISVALSNCERLTRLVNDILDLERIKAGQIHLSVEKVDFTDAVRRVVESNRAFAGSLGVQFQLDLKVRGLVSVDTDRFAQILTNLLSNAAKFSPGGHNVRVFTTRRSEESGRWIRVNIEDQGPGIPLEFQKRIFGRFAQADGTNTRATQGSGLGLSIARALTEKLDGHIGFDSTPGHGATFWVEWREVSA